MGTDEPMVKILSECKLPSPFSVPGLVDRTARGMDGVLERVTQHDFYHLPQYHRVEERRLKATAHLFTYCEGDYLIALPLLFV